jgi:hypothetical protein
MIHKDKQEKWFQNDTAKAESMRIIDGIKTLADYEWAPKGETESILSEAEIEARAIERTDDYLRSCGDTTSKYL